MAQADRLGPKVGGHPVLCCPCNDGSCHGELEIVGVIIIIITVR